MSAPDATTADWHVLARVAASHGGEEESVLLRELQLCCIFCTSGRDGIRRAQETTIICHLGQWHVLVRWRKCCSRPARLCA